MRSGVRRRGSTARAIVAALVLVAWVGAASPATAQVTEPPAVPTSQVFTGDDTATGLEPQVLNGTTLTNPGWVTAVLQDGSYACSGTLIDPEWVLTAAHCATGNHSFSVRVGTTSRLDTSRARSVDLVLVHPDYRSFSLYSVDVALFRLAQPVTDVP
ncbi:MAG: DUF1986 domain-containing protein, partial [Acidimicrobiales bacterium]|nr:DUF1986 domain-containing protein [Acidimicrobiales bacterium]